MRRVSCPSTIRLAHLATANPHIIQARDKLKKWRSVIWWDASMIDQCRLLPRRKAASPQHDYGSYL